VGLQVAPRREDLLAAEAAVERPRSGAGATSAAGAVRMVVSEMGEQMLPKVAPPRQEPMQWRRYSREPPPRACARGPTNGSTMPVGERKRRGAGRKSGRAVPVARLYLGCISAASRLDLGWISAGSRLDLGCISAASRLHLGCILAASRLHLGCISPIVPKEEPDANEMACESSATMGGSDQRGSPSRSERARNVAVPTSAMTAPRAHASRRTSIGSRTSLSPSAHAAIASSSARAPWASTSPRADSQPAAEAQMRAVIESLLDRIETSERGGRDASGSDRTFAAPSASIPPKVARTIVPKGRRALTARRGVPALGSSGPGPPSATAPSPCPSARPSPCPCARLSAVRRGEERGWRGLNSGRPSGPRSFCRRMERGRAARARSGKKRYRTDDTAARKGSST